MQDLLTSMLQSCMILDTLHGHLKLPAFMPDATYGAVKTLSFDDVKATGTQAIVTNTLHLFLRPGDEYIKSHGGLHQFFNWEGIIGTDSGGFQVFSLIHKSGFGKITGDGAEFVSPHNGSTHILTPQSSQQIQHNMGSDIRIVLDDCLDHTITRKEAEEAVERTIRWASQSKQAFLKLEGLSDDTFASTDGSKRPLLFAVVQGGSFPDLRKHCAQELTKIGFDGYNFGGYPLDNKGKLATEVLNITADAIPDDKPKYAMGIGTPEDILTCIKMGYNLFDTVLPTRNARHGYLFTSEGIVRLNNSKYHTDQTVLDPECPCSACTSGYSKAYIRHLIKIKEPAGMRLATIHNLHYYQSIINNNS